MFSDQSCETMYGTLRFLILLSALNMCENLHYESVYFTELYSITSYKESKTHLWENMLDFQRNGWSQ